MKLLLPTFKSWYPFPNSQLTFCLLPTFFRGHLPTPNLVSWAPIDIEKINIQAKKILL